MMEAPMKKKNDVSPKGKAIWPKLSEPETKFDADGVYETNLRLDAETGQKFLAHLEEMLEEHHSNVCKEMGKQVKKGSISYKQAEVDGVHTGELDFKFKMKALAGKAGNKWPQRPKIFDSKGNLQDPKSIAVGSGSTIKVSYSVYPYFTAMVGAGLSLQLKAVQVLDLVEYGGASAGSFGFDTEEGFENTEEAGETENLPDDDSDF
tara:strand:- start:2130 stop:2747 length:618 start_codon:yes stop_codon:yes gene_type:complete